MPYTRNWNARRKAKMLERMILQHFHDLGDADSMFWMSQSEPFASLLEKGEITRLDITQALQKARDAGYLEHRGLKKGTVYRLREKGEARLKELRNES
jgi:hypothetical protein